MAGFVLEFERHIVELEETIERLRALPTTGGVDVSDQVAELERKATELRRKTFADLTPYQRAQISRHPKRPFTLDYVDRLMEDWQELKGDRNYMDDPAIVTGLARFRGQGVAVIGHQKGRTTKENMHRNFGMPRPEGYRKALRIMSLAERFKRPILTFIDTPGAYPGIGAEERGQSEAIGMSLAVMAGLQVPIIATVIGEGGSGGALALGVANRVLMLEFATYSVITPEGCASILWRDGAEAPKAAQQLKLLATDVVKLGVVDEVIAEPRGGAHREPDEAARQLAATLKRHLGELEGLDPQALIDDRYEKFRAMGVTSDA